jgi:hypothetical protein
VAAQLITVEPIEPELTPDRVDERLARGFFPWGQRWMTCLAWPMDEGPRDTVWVRVRLSPRRRSERARRFLRDGYTVALHDEPALDDEHQRLYERFRASRHAEWTEEAADLLLQSGAPSPLLARTRELAVRDAAGQLCAFRWFLQGERAIAGISSVYDTERSGLGSVARELADAWAQQAGMTFSYPGYVWPGAAETWFYKIKRGATEWLDVDGGRWRAWDGDEPRPEKLVLAEMRRQLEPLGDVVSYRGWAAPCVEPSLRGLTAPYFVVREVRGNELTLVVWDFERRRHEQVRVLVPTDDEAPAESDATDGDELESSP